MVMKSIFSTLHIFLFVFFIMFLGGGCCVYQSGQKNENMKLVSTNDIGLKSAHFLRITYENWTSNKGDMRKKDREESSLAPTHFHHCQAPASFQFLFEVIAVTDYGKTLDAVGTGGIGIDQKIGLSVQHPTRSGESEPKVLMEDGAVGTLVRNGSHWSVRVLEYDTTEGKGIFSGRVTIAEDGVVVLSEEKEKVPFVNGELIYGGSKKLDETTRKRVEERIELRDRFLDKEKGTIPTQHDNSGDSIRFFV